MTATASERLPSLFWWANVTELLERAAYYSIASFEGAYIFNDIMARNAVTLESGLLELDPVANATGWLVLMGIGFASAFAVWLFNRYLTRHPVAQVTP